MEIRIRLAKFPLYTHRRLTHTRRSRKKKPTKKQTHQILFPPFTAHIFVRLTIQLNANHVDFSPYFLDSGNLCLFISNHSVPVPCIHTILVAENASRIQRGMVNRLAIFMYTIDRFHSTKPKSTTTIV